MPECNTGWHLCLGANVRDGGTEFRVWAMNARRIDVVLHTAGAARPAGYPLQPEKNGYFAGLVPGAGAGAGARYRYRLDGDDGKIYPDPCSRFQPDGVHGWSEVIDPGFAWTDAGWNGLRMRGLVIYECHVGTFTPEGSFAALTKRLPALRRLGINAVELMPIAAFAGDRNWGYDGVDLFAPFAGYGRPDDLRRLVNTAHRLGLGVLLDVVYNHLGPDGNYLRAFSDAYFTDRHHTPWGEAINYDGPNSRPVRDFVCENACYWLNEYHIDGLRLDATHAIVDDSSRHILAELAARARDATPRSVVIIAEDGRNDVRLIRPVAVGGYGLDAVWADDFHHAVHVCLTGERDGYYADYAGTTDEIAKAINEGFVFQGQPSSFSGHRRGTVVTDEPASAFVFSLQNHDQIGNRAFGQRLSALVSPGNFAVASVLLLFAPETPLLFMGQGFASSNPFQYFTDHEPGLGALVTEGRRQEFAAFATFQDEARRDRIPDPQAAQTFARSQIDWGERRDHSGMYRLYRALLSLRRTDPVLMRQDRTTTRAWAIDDRAVAAMRWHEGAYRVLIANFGAAVDDTLSDFAGFERFVQHPNVVVHQPGRSPAAPTRGVGSENRVGAAGGRPRWESRVLDVAPPAPKGRWYPLLSTAWRRFGGNSDPSSLRAHRGVWCVRVPAETAVIFAWDIGSIR